MYQSLGNIISPSLLLLTSLSETLVAVANNRYLNENDK